MLKQLMTIQKNEALTKDIYRIVLQGAIPKTVSPGQFMHILIPDGQHILRRPISIFDVSFEAKTVTLMYRINGKGTAILAQCQQGDILNVLGSLGNGFPINECHQGETVYLIGGGIGIPPLYFAGKQLVQRHVNVVYILGYRDKSSLFAVEEFEALAKLHIATDDGSVGVSGTVTKIMETLPIPDKVMACGPHMMLKAINTYYEQEQTEIYISLEERMACGIGACYGCVVPSTEGMMQYKVCHDGPVFNARKVKL